MSKDTISGGFLLLLSVFIIEQSPKWSLWKSGPEAGFLPFLLGLLLGILSIILVFKDILKGKVEKEKVEKEIYPDKKIRFIFFVLLIFFYCLTFKPLGFLISTMSFLILTIYFVETQTWKKAIWFSMTLTTAYYVTFYIFLKIPLPRGFLNF
jgi:putative tricarboxylic transport membrane protein